MRCRRRTRHNIFLTYTYSLIYNTIPGCHENPERTLRRAFCSSKLNLLEEFSTSTGRRARGFLLRVTELKLVRFPARREINSSSTFLKDIENCLHGRLDCKDICVIFCLGDTVFTVLVFRVEFKG
mmetsp:Transcript_23411/g.35075  ORF Transcript_23411/g.35075 Transcript_23411/m.35075 type:complete len:125 (+) Transcript_23411:53-427(+)